jgi:hypothetical protein
MILNLQFKNLTRLLVLLNFGLLPILPRALQSITIILSIAILIPKIKFSYNTFKNIFFYILLLLSIVWSSNLSNIIGYVKISVVYVIGIIISTNLKNDNRLRHYLKYGSFFFIISTILLIIKKVIYLNYGYPMSLHFNGDISLISKPFFERLSTVFSLPYDTIYSASQAGYPNGNPILHRNYFGTILLISILLLIKNLRYNNLVASFFVLCLISLFLLILFYIKSKINILLLPILGLVVIIKKLNLKNNLIAIVFLFSLIFLLFNFNVITQYIKTHEYERYNLYLSLSNIIKHNFLWGIGVGDVYDTINKNVLDNNLKLNAHSEYLNFIASAGVFCFLGFLYLTFKILYNSIRNPIVFIMYLCIFSNCIFENFLSRSVGSYLFFYILVLFPVLYLQDE